MAQRQQTIPLRGGLDLVSPALAVRPGRAISAENYEADVQGYTRMTGFERFDGRPKPSEASYTRLDFAVGSSAIAEDATVTGGTSGATGIAVRATTATSGTFAGGDAEGVLYLYNVTGTFVSGEDLEVSASKVAESTSAPVVNGAADDGTNTDLTAEVAVKRRAVIAKPAGSGPVRGAATLGSNIYCWRDNAGGTAGVMYRATSSGWAAMTFPHILLFSTGNTAELQAGETITGGTSGATAQVDYVARTSGAWSGTAAGTLVLSSISGTFQNAETITGGTSSGTAVITAIPAVPTLPPGGTYRAISENFFATEGTEGLYFVNGVGRAHALIGGNYLVPIRTGLSDALDKPTYVGSYRLHLFLGYAPGSLQHSAPGLPLTFGAVDGAAEIGVGQEITGLTDTLDALICATKSRIFYLTGATADDFVLRRISRDTGARHGTLTVLREPVFMDDLGLRQLSAVQSYGDWQVGTLTDMVEPFIRTKAAANTSPLGVIRVRQKAQARIVFDDGTGLFVYLGRRDPEILPFNLGFTPSFVTAQEDNDGRELLFAGSDDGWLYQLDAGPSMDGEAMKSHIRLAPINNESPNTAKRYHTLRIEGQSAPNGSTISVAADFTYGDPNQPSASGGDVIYRGLGGSWNEVNWNEFTWSVKTTGQAFVDVPGIGENIAPVFYSETAAEVPHTLSAVTIYFSPRRARRA